VTAAFLVAAGILVVQASSPPLSPAEAVRVLRAGRSIADRTDVYVPSPAPPPRVIVVKAPAPPRAERVPSLAEIPWAVRQAVPWRHVAPAAEDPTIRTVRIIR